MGVMRVMRVMRVLRVMRVINVLIRVINTPLVLDIREVSNKQTKKEGRLLAFVFQCCPCLGCFCSLGFNN